LSVSGNQVRVDALFDDSPLIDDQDPIAGQYRGEAMADQQGGQLAQQLFERRLPAQRLAFRVQRGCCFIQQQ
jgi:hypothetical protein